MRSTAPDFALPRDLDRFTALSWLPPGCYVPLRLQPSRFAACARAVALVRFSYHLRLQFLSLFYSYPPFNLPASLVPRGSIVIVRSGCGYIIACVLLLPDSRGDMVFRFMRG